MKTRYFSCDVHCLPDIRAFVREMLVQLAVPQQVAPHLVLAVEEICANVIIHGNQHNPLRQLQLSLGRVDGFVLVETRDTGAAFNPQAYREHSIEELVEARRRGGVGLQIARRMMDHVDYHRHGNQNVWTLFKKVTGLANEAGRPQAQGRQQR